MEQHDNAACVTAFPIDEAREAIDTLDLQIIEILQNRRDLSRRIQRQRMSEGGTRTVLAREKLILDRYVTGLGTEGTALALNILSLCRGGSGGISRAASAADGEPQGTS
ncbi:chorismate mutase [Streptomyces sp. SID625]|nr:chorismate mutase [Streptomyces sp. SID625]